MTQTHGYLRKSRQRATFTGAFMAFLLSLVVTGLTMAAPSIQEGGLAVSDLRCEDLVDPIGIDVSTPRLSWKMKANNNGAAQTAYQILCATEPELLKEGAADLWDSGKVTTSQSQHIIYGGKSLSRGAPYFWTVRLWNEKGVVSPSSRPAVWTYFDMAATKDWRAKWITDNSSSPWLRQSLELTTPPERAYLYINALGYFQLFINGERVEADEFAPHVGQYNKRTFCLTYDVTKHLKKGPNAIAFWLGSGWSRGGAGVKTAPSVRAQLEVVDAEGDMTTLVTDLSWRAKASSMAYRGGWGWNKYGGEVHTASLDEPNWADAGFDDSAWPTAKQAKVADTIVSSEMLQRNRVIETITPVKVTKLDQGSKTTVKPMATTEAVTIKILKAMYGVADTPDQQIDLSATLQKMVDAKEYRFKMTNRFAGNDPARNVEKTLRLEYDLNGKRIARRIDENQQYDLTAVETQERSTSWLVDMGKAMTGTFEITFPKAEQGRKISMEFGDSYTTGPDGGVAKMNSFRQASEYICRGSGIETFRNRFNYASCRYILIKNAPAGKLLPEHIKGNFITTDLPKASTFRCSNETLNKIYGMMDHTLRCLMLGGYQVDCHSRERFGYGGDAHSSLDTTLCFQRSDAFYRKFTRDWLDGQNADGGFTYTSPSSGHGGGPFWCGFLTAATLKHYHHYGDISLVRRNYPAIKKWFKMAQSKTENHLQKKFCGRWYLGDWASPRGVDDKANAEVFIHPYMSYALEQAAQLADALNERADASMFRQWAEDRNTATHGTFYDVQSGRYGSGDQVTYILPLISGVVPDKLTDKVFASFEKTLMETNNGHLSTGLAGTYMMIQYLQRIGRDDLIYNFASKKTYPSWGHMIENGATATWEHWEGDRGTRIHNCYNNIGSWFIQGLAGIRPDPQNPGFKNAIIQPAFLDDLTFVHGTHDTAYGTIQSDWKREGDVINLAVTIPANSTATVHLPADAADGVTVNGLPIEKAERVTIRKIEGKTTIVDVGSGCYEFSCKPSKTL